MSIIGILSSNLFAAGAARNTQSSQQGALADPDVTMLAPWSKRLIENAPTMRGPYPATPSPQSAAPMNSAPLPAVMQTPAAFSQQANTESNAPTSLSAPNLPSYASNTPNTPSNSYITSAPSNPNMPNTPNTPYPAYTPTAATYASASQPVAPGQERLPIRRVLRYNFSAPSGPGLATSSATTTWWCDTTNPTK